MNKIIFATALVIGLTTAVTFTSGNAFAESGDRVTLPGHKIEQTTAPATDLSMNPMTGHDMSKMPMNDRMATMEKRMAMMGEMMSSCGMIKQQDMKMK